jgi:hypothetical protein
MQNEELRMKKVWGQRMAGAGALFLQTLREIFDEAAYARFLARNDASRSRQSYAAFLRENGFQRERRARCC